MYEETLDQATLKDNTNFVKLLESKGIVPGIKVDKGLTVINHSKGENAT